MNIVLNYNNLKEIYLNKEIHIDWRNILIRTDVNLYLAVNKEEREYLFDSNSDIYKFMHLFNNGGFFKIFSNDINFDLNPSFVFFDSKLLTLKSGSLVIDDNSLFNPFKFEYFKTLIKGKISNSWKTIFTNRNLISNALILNDPYIFHSKDDEKNYIIRDKNIIDLIDSILPKELDISYHILINSSIIFDMIDEERIFKPKSYYDEFIDRLIDKIQTLRDYEIIIEIVIGKGFHKRKLFTNFLNVTTDKGFKIFDNIDAYKVLEHNDILIETMFTRNDPDKGDSQYDEMKVRLQELKKLINNSLDWVNADSYNDIRSFYYSNSKVSKPYKIQNRLYNSN